MRGRVQRARRARGQAAWNCGTGSTVHLATILKQHWNAKPSSREPRRGLSPRVACKNKWARIEALQRNKAFIEKYRDARTEKLAGRDVVLPAGNWWLHRFAGVKRAEPEATAPPA